MRCYVGSVGVSGTSSPEEAPAHPAQATLPRLVASEALTAFFYQDFYQP